MATSEIAGLFTTPEQYQLAQQQAQQAQALQYAQLDPRAQAQYGFYRGGQQLAQGVGGLLGVQDPQMQLIANRQKLASMLDQTDPESYNKVANLAIQNGDPQFGMLLAQEGRKVEESLAGINLKKSQADKNAAWKQTQTDSAQKRQAISALEEKLATDPNYKPSAQELAQTRWIIANETKPKSMIDPTTGQLMVIEGLDVNAAAPNLANYLKQAGVGIPTAQPAPAETGATGVTTTPVATPTTPAMTQIAPGVKALPTPASAIKAKEEAEKQATIEEQKIKDAEAAQEALASVQNVRQTIAETSKLAGPMTTGWGSYLSVFPSDARVLSNNTKTIQANLALNKLMELKQQSKTGASGLGALNMKELEAIQSTISNLDPVSPNYKNDLKKIDDFFARTENLMSKRESRATARATPSTQPSQSSDEAKIQRFIDFNGGRPKREDAIRELRKAGVIK